MILRLASQLTHLTTTPPACICILKKKKQKNMRFCAFVRSIKCSKACIIIEPVWLLLKT